MIRSYQKLRRWRREPVGIVQVARIQDGLEWLRRGNDLDDALTRNVLLHEGHELLHAGNI